MNDVESALRECVDSLHGGEGIRVILFDAESMKTQGSASPQGGATGESSRGAWATSAIRSCPQHASKRPGSRLWDCLANILRCRIVRTATGKPLCQAHGASAMLGASPTWHVSISHCGDVTALALSDRYELGLDLVRTDAYVHPSILGPGDSTVAHGLSRAEVFALKEAVIKHAGSSLGSIPTIHLSEHADRLWHARHHGFTIALCADAPRRDLPLRDATPAMGKVVAAQAGLLRPLAVSSGP